MMWGGGLGRELAVSFLFPGQPADEFFISWPTCWSIFFIFWATYWWTFFSSLEGLVRLFFLDFARASPRIINRPSLSLEMYEILPCKMNAFFCYPMLHTGDELKTYCTHVSKLWRDYWYDTLSWEFIWGVYCSWSCNYTSPGKAALKLWLLYVPSIWSCTVKLKTQFMCLFQDWCAFSITVNKTGPLGHTLESGT